jgi:hypothetical protein
MRYLNSNREKGGTTLYGHHQLCTASYLSWIDKKVARTFSRGYTTLTVGCTVTQHHNAYSSALAMTVKYESTGIEGRNTGSRDEESDSRKEKMVIQNAKKAAICPKTGRNEHNKTK